MKEKIKFAILELEMAIKSLEKGFINDAMRHVITSMEAVKEDI